jgi:hypothetical protein
MEYLTKELGEGTVELMRTVKKAIDPYNLFNPGKVSTSCVNKIGIYSHILCSSTPAIPLRKDGSDCRILDFATDILIVRSF